MSEYQQEALDFLMDSGTEMKIKFVEVVDGFPNDPDDTHPRKKYMVTMTRGSKGFSTPFYDSTYNYIKGLRPTEYDVLACLEKYEVPDTLEDFASEFGYDISEPGDRMRIRKIWQACRTQYEKLVEFFGDEWMPRLQEIY